MVKPVPEEGALAIGNGRLAPIPIATFPESLSQAILEGIILVLVGRLGVGYSRTRGPRRAPKGYSGFSSNPLKMSRKFPIDMRCTPLKIKIMLESNPLKSKILVLTLGV